jgi:hypothetical protein
MQVLPPLGRLAKVTPSVVFDALQQLEALGLNVPSVLQQLGIDASAFGTAVGASAPEIPSVAVSAGPVTKQ